MTNRFLLTIGLNKGYFHENNNKVYSSTEVGRLFNELAKVYYERNNVYVTFSLIEGKTFYSQKWGCPIDGEETVIITGVCNLEYTELSNWKKAVLNLAKEIKVALEQTTCTVEFIESELHYLKDH